MARKSLRRHSKVMNIYEEGGLGLLNVSHIAEGVHSYLRSIHDYEALLDRAIS